jgi:serine/threonine protein kinase
VFKGVDEKSKELVAVKMLSKSVINEDEYLRDGLMNEIRIMRDLRGNNVVRLIDVLETSNNYYLV